MKSLLENFVSKEKIREYSEYLTKEIASLRESVENQLEQKQVEEDASKEYENTLDDTEFFDGEPVDAELYPIGSFVLLEIATETFVNASVDAVYSDSEYYRYDVTTEHGLRVIGVYEHRLHSKPPYSEEHFA